MHTDESGRLAFEFAADKSDVLIVVNVAGVGNHAEVAVARGKNGFGDAAEVMAPEWLRQEFQGIACMMAAKYGDPVKHQW